MANTDFNKLLQEKWTGLFESKEGESVFVSNFDGLSLRPLEKNYVAYYNPQRLEKKPDYGTFDEQGDDEESKEDKIPNMSVYYEFDENKFNFNSCKPNEILFYVNLDEEEIITKEKEAEFD
jgi:hypothetical protein